MKVHIDYTDEIPPELVEYIPGSGRGEGSRNEWVKAQIRAAARVAFQELIDELRRTKELRHRQALDAEEAELTARLERIRQEKLGEEAA